MSGKPVGAAPAKLRLDVWLWRARFFKTRTLAARAVEDGAVRLSRNGASRRVSKPGEMVSLGDGLSIAAPSGLRTVEIVAFGDRRGPPAQARALYRELGEVKVEGRDG